MKQLLLLITAAVLFSSCGKQLTPFTDQLKAEYGWGPEQLKQIQFYTSNNITINKNVEQGESTSIKSGTITTVNGKQVEQVFIKRFTPGVAVQFPNAQKVGVSFEIDDNHYLSFGPNPKLDNRYYLLADKWNNRIGTVHYNNQQFQTVPGSEKVYLMVDMRRVRKLDVSNRKAKGRTIK